MNTDVCMFLKLNTPLGSRLCKYYKWKTNNTRHVITAFVRDDSMIQIRSCVSCVNLSKRAETVLTEWVAVRIMDLEITQNKL
jgi:hypothetical protein